VDNIRSNIEKLLLRPMDRREFLKFSGIMVLSVIGVVRILQAFNFYSSKQTPNDGGWGHTAYGGSKNHTVS
jgi:hypothetical protein